MSKLSFIDYVLNPYFKINDNYLEEPSVPMKIDLIKEGCQSIVFQFDKQLEREYKGGIFPFLIVGCVVKLCFFMFAIGKVLFFFEK